MPKRNKFWSQEAAIPKVITVKLTMPQFTVIAEALSELETHYQDEGNYRKVLLIDRATTALYHGKRLAQEKG